MRAFEESIVALITGPAPTPIAVIRVSGGRSWEQSAELFQPWKPEHARAQFGTFLNGDQGYALTFAEGRSYTGEPTVEFMMHGSKAVVQSFLEACYLRGIRHAKPGEFTLRAFLSGRMDLSQAESVRDTIEAETLAEHQQASRHGAGQLSKAVSALRGEATRLLAVLEVSVDFSEETGELDTAKFRTDLVRLKESLAALKDDARFHRILREGFRIAIVGPPNAGKSSLFNALLKDNRAIVTPLPGTTRDTLDECLEWSGHKVILVDTAGLRETQEPIEKLGIDRTLQTIEQADAIWFVFDGTQVRPSDAPVGSLMIANKSDLPEHRPQSAHSVSAVTGMGLRELVETAVAQIESQQPRLVPNPRQEAHLAKAHEAIEACVETLDANRPSDLLAVQLQAAIYELGLIVGESADPDLLERIFGDFCIGK